MLKTSRLYYFALLSIKINMKTQDTIEDHKTLLIDQIIDTNK